MRFEPKDSRIERVANVRKQDLGLSTSDELHRAWLLLRAAARRFDRIAREESWPTPFAPIRYLILAELDRATDHGLSARRLSRSLSVPPPTLAHHLDVLERGGFCTRVPWGVHDGRKVAVRLTDEGRYAVRRLAAMSSPAMASP
jgi:DNA-binding MarR family transcriptional regulator